MLSLGFGHVSFGVGLGLGLELCGFVKGANKQLEKKLLSYVDAIHPSASSPSTTPLSDILHKPEFALLLPLFERIVCRAVERSIFLIALLTALIF